MHKLTLKSFLSNFAAIIFDLDGVILDSMQLKVNCMKKALSDFDEELVTTYLNDFMNHFGKSRSWHFQNFYFNYLGKTEYFDGFYQTYAKRYARLLALHYHQVDLCRHAAELIPQLHAQGIKLFVATGTATEEAKMVLNHKLLIDYFVDIFGSPLEKTTVVETICQKLYLADEKILLIGDAIHDRDSAFNNKIPFLFVEAYALLNRYQMIDPFGTTFYAVNSLNHGDLVEKVTL